MPWPPRAGVEHIGHQHGVVDGADLDAAQREHLPVVLQVLADLEDAASSSSGLSAASASLLGDLLRRRAPPRTGRSPRRRRPRGGRAARSRPRSARPRARCRTAPPASDRGRSVSVSIATTPASLARAIQASRRSSVSHVSYFARSILAWRAALRAARDSDTGVSGSSAVRLLRRALGRRRVDSQSPPLVRPAWARRTPMRQPAAAAASSIDAPPIGLDLRSRRCRPSRRRGGSAS